MKKLLLLAVVVFGFGASSFAQKDASTSIQLQFQLPTSPNAGASIGWVNDMDFAKINYTGAAGYVWIKPDGTSDHPNITVTGTPKPATFYIKGLKSGNPDLTVTPSTVVNVGTGVTFETGNGSSFLASTLTNANDGNYTVKLGGQLTFTNSVSGTITIPSVTVTINNP